MKYVIAHAWPRYRKPVVVLLAVAALIVGGQGIAQPPEALPELPPAPPVFVPQPELRTFGILRNGRIGMPYDVVVIQGGVPGYTFQSRRGLPPGLDFQSDGRSGRLVGTPTKAGYYSFHVMAADSAVPPDRIRGDWTLRIDAPRRPAVPFHPKPKPGPITVNCPQSAMLPGRAAVPGEITYYRLGLKDLMTLGKAPLFAPLTDPVAVSKPLAPPTRDNCQAVVVAPAAPVVAVVNHAGPAKPGLVAAASLSLVPAQPLPPATPRLPVAPPAPPPAPPVWTPADIAARPGREPRPPLPDMNISPSLTTLLRPMAEIEYPTRSAFELSVEYHLGGFGVTPAARRQITDLAAHRENFASSGHPIWQGEDNCHCVRAQRPGDYSIVYGFLPFWQASVAETEKHPVAFSLFDRIGFLGLQLDDDGGWTGGLASATSSEFARTAQSRGTRLDLVLQRSRWLFLDGVPDAQLRRLSELAASQAIQEVQKPVVPQWRDWALIGPWHSPRHVYDGVTVMFAPPKCSDYDNEDHFARATASFEIFFDRFMTMLIAGLHETHREQAVSIVLDTQRQCNGRDARFATGAFDIQRLGEYRRLAHLQAVDPSSSRTNATIPMVQRNRPAASEPPAPRQPDENGGGRYQSISFHLLVVVPEYAGDAKKWLRAQIDQLTGPMFDGRGRNELLHSIVPIMFHHGGDPQNLPDETVTQFQKARTSADLAYYIENFGGVAFWPVPMAGIGDGDWLVAATRTTLADAATNGGVGEPTAMAWLPAWLGTTQCNIALRLAWELGILLIVGGYALYYYREDSERVEALYFWAASGVAVLVALLSLVLLATDPVLAALSEGNAPLWGMVLIVGAAIAFAFLKRAVRSP